MKPLLILFAVTLLAPSYWAQSGPEEIESTTVAIDTGSTDLRKALLDRDQHYKSTPISATIDESNHSNELPPVTAPKEALETKEQGTESAPHDESDQTGITKKESGSTESLQSEGDKDEAIVEKPFFVPMSKPGEDQSFIPLKHM